MKKFANLFLLILISTFLFSCGEKRNAEKVAKGFLTQLYTMHYDSAKTFCTKESYGYVDFRKLIDVYILKDIKSQMDKLKIEIVETKIDGNNAECKYSITGIAELAEENQIINLIKKENKWIIDLHAENLNFDKPLPNDTLIGSVIDTTSIE